MTVNGTAEPFDELRRQCLVLERFSSRRNQVIKVGMQMSCCPGAMLVLKQYNVEAKAETEFINLLKLEQADIKAPRPLALSSNIVYLQYLNGLLLTDIIEKRLLAQSVWTEKLAGWYADLHKIGHDGSGRALLKTDNNLRNFIYADSNFFGLDFEEIEVGDPARDIGQVCAFILSDRPAFSIQKKAATAELVQHYCARNRVVRNGQIEKEVMIELEKMAERRRDERRAIKDYLNSLARGNRGFLSG